MSFLPIYNGSVWRCDGCDKIHKTQQEAIHCCWKSITLEKKGADLRCQRKYQEKGR